MRILKCVFTHMSMFYLPVVLGRRVRPKTCDFNSTHLS